MSKQVDLDPSKKASAQLGEKLSNRLFDKLRCVFVLESVLREETLSLLRIKMEEGEDETAPF